MDLVDWSAERYEEIRDEFMDFCRRLEIKDVIFIPMSALHGDNVVERSLNMPWYKGATLLAHLEDVYIGSDDNLLDPRFPVQYVIRPQTAEHHDYRGYAGTVASGMFRPGDEIIALPSGYTSTIKAIDSPRGPLTEAFSPMAVTLTLTDEIAVSRGDMICRLQNRPTVTQDIEAVVCWMSERSTLQPGSTLLVKHTTRTVRATVDAVHYRLDVNSLHRESDVHRLGLNEIGRVSLRTTEPLCVDAYQMNRATGSFVLIDPVTNATVGAGMVRVVAKVPTTGNVVRFEGRMTPDERVASLGYRGATVLLTGLSGAGKSTVAAVAEVALIRRGRPGGAARRGQPAARPVRGPGVLRRRSDREPPASRRGGPPLGRGRGGRPGGPHQPRRGRTATGCGRSTKRPGWPSSRCSSTPPSMSASGATRRASTGGPGPGSSSGSPGSTPPTRRRTTPS